MSSYHVLNAVWVGVFPMLAVSLVIGICCYILCCLNRLKIRIREYRKRNQPETVENVLIRQKRLNKINHFDKSIKVKRSHTSINNIQDINNDKPNNASNLISNQNSHNFKSQPQFNDSSNYYYNNYSKANDYTHNNKNVNQNLTPLPPSYFYNNKQSNQLVNVSTSDYFEPVKTTLHNLKSSVPSLPQSAPQRTTTFSRSNLSLNLTHNHNRFEQKSPNEDDDENEEEEEDDDEEETDNEEPITVRASDDDDDELIVEELKESPKSTYSRYFSNIRLNRTPPPIKESSCSPINIIEIDESPKTSRLNYLLYSRHTLTETNQLHSDNNNNVIKDEKSKLSNKQETSMSETKSLSSESYERLTTNEFTSNRSTSISSLNETIQTKKNSQKMFKLRKKNLNQNKRIKTKTAKKFSAIGSGSSYDNTRSSNLKLQSPSKQKSRSKLRLITLNKNKISSDIDIEDDLIFNDDTDSLSSAGVSCTPPVTLPKAYSTESKNTLVNSNKNFSNDNSNVNKFKSNSDNEKIQSKTGNTHIKTSYSVDTQIKLAKINANSCSISDIDPDDNILNNLLIKQKSKENT